MSLIFLISLKQRRTFHYTVLLAYASSQVILFIFACPCVKSGRSAYFYRLPKQSGVLKLSSNFFRCLKYTAKKRKYDILPNKNHSHAIIWNKLARLFCLLTLPCNPCTIEKRSNRTVERWLSWSKAHDWK